MTISDFVTTVSGYVITGYSFWSGVERSMYNAEKTVADTMLLVLPKRWPSEWKESCSSVIQVDFYIGKVVSLTAQQPFVLDSLRDQLIDDANSFFAELNTDAAIMVRSVDYESPEEISINSQVWIKCIASLKVWNV